MLGELLVGNGDESLVGTFAAGCSSGTRALLLLADTIYPFVVTGGGVSGGLLLIFPASRKDVLSTTEEGAKEGDFGHIGCGDVCDNDLRLSHRRNKRRRDELLAECCKTGVGCRNLDLEVGEPGFLVCDLGKQILP